MLQVTVARLQDALQAHGGYTHILAFKPTGWTFKSRAKQAPLKAPVMRATPPAAMTSPAPLRVHASLRDRKAECSERPRSSVDVLMASYRHQTSGIVAPEAAHDAFAVMRGAAKKQACRAATSVPQGAKAQQDRPPWISVRKQGAVEVVDVPYSEHSSCRELQEFVAWLQPVAIMPTVGGATAAQRNALLTVLAGERAGGAVTAA